jgi:hypothetical protein
LGIKRIFASYTTFFDFDSSDVTHGQCRRSTRDTYGHSIDFFGHSGLHDFLYTYYKDKNHRKTSHEDYRLENQINHDLEAQIFSYSSRASSFQSFIFEKEHRKDYYR